jgi:hypothetical protein
MSCVLASSYLVKPSRRRSGLRRIRNSKTPDGRILVQGSPELDMKGPQGEMEVQRRLGQNQIVLSFLASTK